MNRDRKPRILIAHQGCVPIYRKAFYERLAAISDIEYVILHGNPPHNSDLIPAPEPYDFPNIRVENINRSLFKKDLVYQPILRRVLKGEFDGFVLGDEVHFVSSMMIALVAILRRWPIVLWGFGYHPDYQAILSEGALGRLMTQAAGILKRGLYQAIDGYLVYTESAAKLLSDKGVPRNRIAVLRNTIDVEAQLWLKNMIAAEPLADSFRFFGFDGSFPILLYFGRFFASKRIDLLIDYVGRTERQGRKVGLLVFGAGVEKERLVKQAADLPHVRFFTHDDLALTRALRISSAVVIPGFLGLAVTHAFAHGVPMITRTGQPHSPEIDYLRHGENGLVLPENHEAFFAGLDSYLADKELQERLRVGAAASADQLKIENMVEAFDSLVRRILIAKSLQSSTK